VAVCLPCGHTVDEAKARSWEYKDTTFYFCAPGCEEEVKEAPEKWLTVAKSGVIQEHPGHGHSH
jgi:YHS domain-containing protein